MIYTQLIRNFLPSVHSLIQNNGAVQAIIKVRTMPDSIPDYNGVWFEYANNLDLYCETKYGWMIVDKRYDSPFYRIIYYLEEDKDKERALKELVTELIKLNKDSMKGTK